MKRCFFSLFLLMLLMLLFACTQKINPDSNPETKPDADSKDETKLYTKMDEDEKNRFIAAKSREILALFGPVKDEKVSTKGLGMIRTFVDGYVKRLSNPTLDSCNSNDWVRTDLASVLKRGSHSAAFISEGFSAQELAPQIGLYLAMLESEFCPCLQAPTGGLGMFQWTTSMGEKYGLKTERGASPANPDERCEPKLAAGAAGKYMKVLTARFGTGPASVPLAIAAYNSGEDSLSKNLDTAALKSNEGLPGDFWTLMENSDKLSKQFQAENMKYVPKFFAAAIIGENPKTFGIDMPPLSQAK